MEKKEDNPTEKFLITEVNIAGEKSKSNITDEDAPVEQQIFSVEEAIPPNDFESPYSPMPSNVVTKRVKVNNSPNLNSSKMLLFT
jgi:hypothetical protein